MDEMTDYIMRRHGYDPSASSEIDVLDYLCRHLGIGDDNISINDQAAALSRISGDPAVAAGDIDLLVFVADKYAGRVTTGDIPLPLPVGTGGRPYSG